MILRRFMKHVTDQNWFAVGLDVIVVIVGIFLGLQVQEWSEGRVDREEEKRVVGFMISDMEKTLSYLDNRNALYDDQIILTDKAVEILEIGALKTEDVDDFEKALITSGRMYILDAYVNAFNDDNISQILDANLRRSIANYLSRVKRISTAMATIREVNFDAQKVIGSKAPYRLRQIEEDIIYYNFDMLKNDASFRAAVIRTNSTKVSAKDRLIVFTNISRLLLQTLKKYQSGKAVEAVTFM